MDLSCDVDRRRTVGFARPGERERLDVERTMHEILDTNSTSYASVIDNRLTGCALCFPVVMED